MKTVLERAVIDPEASDFCMYVSTTSKVRSSIQGRDALSTATHGRGKVYTASHKRQLSACKPPLLTLAPPRLILPLVLIWKRRYAQRKKKLLRIEECAKGVCMGCNLPPIHPERQAKTDRLIITATPQQRVFSNLPPPLSRQTYYPEPLPPPCGDRFPGRRKVKLRLILSPQAELSRTSRTSCALTLLFCRLRVCPPAPKSTGLDGGGPRLKS